MKNSFRFALIIWVSAFLLTSKHSLACTSFAFRSGECIVQAYNFDFPNIFAGHGFFNPSGLEKKSFNRNVMRKEFVGTPLTWKAEFASFSFSPVGADFPITGVNEAGLSVTLLEQKDLPGQSSNLSQPFVTEVQFVQYLLDTSHSLGSAIENAQKVRVVNSIVMGHYFVCTSQGCVILEYGPEGFRIFTPSAMAIENKTFRSSLQSLAESTDTTLNYERYKRAVALARNYSALGNDPLGYAYSGLETLTQPHTQWQIIYTLKENENPQFAFRLSNRNAANPVEIRAEINFEELKKSDGRQSFSLYKLAKEASELALEPHGRDQAKALLQEADRLIYPIRHFLEAYESENVKTNGQCSSTVRLLLPK
jgi:hypothetical protein